MTTVLHSHNIEYLTLQEKYKEDQHKLQRQYKDDLNRSKQLEAEKNKKVLKFKYFFHCPINILFFDLSAITFFSYQLTSKFMSDMKDI